jgi:hypothetical protein
MRYGVRLEPPVSTLSSPARARCRFDRRHHQPIQIHHCQTHQRPAGHARRTRLATQLLRTHHPGRPRPGSHPRLYPIQPSTLDRRPGKSVPKYEEVNHPRSALALRCADRFAGGAARLRTSSRHPPARRKGSPRRPPDARGGLASRRSPRAPGRGGRTPRAEKAVLKAEQERLGHLQAAADAVEAAAHALLEKAGLAYIAGAPTTHTGTPLRPAPLRC